MGFVASGMNHKLGRRAAVRKAALGFGLFLIAGVKARAQPKPPLKLMILGDSITAGYGLPEAEAWPVKLEAALKAAGQEVRVLAAGVSGDTTAGGRARLDWALADRPDAVIVALGGNDGLRGLPPAESQANLEDILSRLKARGLPVLLAGMLAPPNLGADYGRDFSATFTNLAKAHPEVVFYPFLLDGVAGDPAMNQPDRIHPNPQGVAEMIRRMMPAVQALLAKAQSNTNRGA
ncbi:arylesterase [Pseudoroseomonas ludipueritiae]|uniref:Arylesterase n=1 Tax=Pseudoroseomonas ludipueritiae TaxID=198093 RepID=A0ABR7R979_9PROT|nr:arylesterase [Pseudoroseomonas ludipueritiae]MBC9178236.1 arylesterase [Pseudoroseomonas ludipueritiae]MCG7364412.1 arylesterase [Roseomonas sp. ACRSG]